MAVTVEQTWLLECTAGTSDKYYQVDLVKDGNLWQVRSYYSKIGSRTRNPENNRVRGNRGCSTRRMSYRDFAEGAARKLVQQKLNKGYVQVTPTATEKKAEKKKEEPATFNRFEDVLD